jgi:hypothetical protein
MKCLVERTQQLILGGEDENKTTSILTNAPNKLKCYITLRWKGLTRTTTLAYSAQFTTSTID